MKFLGTMPAVSIVLAAGLAGAGCSGRWPDAAAANATLKRSVQAKYVDEPVFANIRVNADAAHNQVSLSGSVATEQVREEAVTLAKSTNSTPLVIDNIEVGTADDHSAPDQAAEGARAKARVLGEKIGHSLGDAWIYSRVEAKLVQREAAPALKIDVDVDNDIVTLRGEVKSAAMKYEAERIARETEGVRDVRNLLQVRA